ncbi:Golgi SNAP receptor complex member 2 [Amphibalanus amphitrite]|uniref:Golgi SNAP receptor complex member 2 n=1 Tax=Amphibalanus amphitrite TaxID=1232801 RepID=A0A6A4W1W4_AMPAM|nr:Golgi SNAP receptor complex member 2-like [Amphibalanus amphitrite]XP_043217542.1 Golgi SNAP receptor complex member 2-like [Amphibalanus amphitrite]XP_043217543.1 Golgi SNAP receptor complex member 2-like [Amphibalanus amphitrite]XP_043231015.1 Golgi SNAP receptor complex member 2-like [Amphibalanus amphitrite]XP_043231016.1 Golgi SNAP receptor complex member 2-like [Amphibalanus amphitrite]XP_043231017.1 Golgi SNAP receptor complex member 2-like [Amphibalanus amphitrite]KAF0301246.1 Golg
METLYHQTNGLIQRTQHGFAALEVASAAEAETRERELNSAIDTIVSNCKRLDILADKEPVQRRHSAKQRVNQLKYECQHLQSALRALQHRRMARERERLDREELLSQRFTTNDQSDTSIAIDAALQMNDRLQSSHHGMDNLLDMGNSVLTSLRDQRGVLKGARRRMLDLANTLGMSNTVMRLTERRAAQDKFILFGGMLATLVVMYVTWRYLT